MRQRRCILMILACVLLEATWAHYFRVFSVKPDLLLICLVMAGSYFFGSTVLGLSLVCGIAKDLFGLNPFGVFTLVYPVVCFGIIQISKRIDLESGLVKAAVLFVASICSDLLVRLILTYMAAGVSMGIYSKITLLQACYTTALLWPASGIFKKVVLA